MIHLLLLLIYPFLLVGLPALKILGVIRWSWFWVLTPLWFPLVWVFVILAPISLILIGLAIV